MLLSEPNRTDYDLHFHVLGIPVRVHPLFWLAALVLGGTAGEALGLLIWIVCLFVSILVHELGHALMMRRYGISSHIVLYMMGGLAISDGYGFSKRGTDSRASILISAAGPGAGFLLAGAVILLIVASQGTFSVGEYALRLPGAPSPQFEIPMLFFSFALSSPPTPEMMPWYELTHSLLAINIFWGMVNLLPVFPLDGGQIARQILTDKDPWGGTVKSLWLSVFTGGAMAAVGLLLLNSFFIGILFGLLAVQSYMAIQQMGGGGYGGGRPW